MRSLFFPCEILQDISCLYYDRVSRRVFQEEGMTHRTHAVAKTRAHQVRWSSRCRSRTAGAGAGAAAGARGAAAAGRGRTTQLRLSSASTLVDGSPQLQRSSHALLRPQESKCKMYG